jgi:hypothetical protein
MPLKELQAQELVVTEGSEEEAEEACHTTEEVVVVVAVSVAVTMEMARALEECNSFCITSCIMSGDLDSWQLLKRTLSWDAHHLTGKNFFKRPRKENHDRHLGPTALMISWVQGDPCRKWSSIGIF